jgi:predicted  nucleic acid-binding Zn-ribbon protein
MSKTPLTDAAFEKADNNHSPEFGEGWEGFANSIKLDMQDLERRLETMKLFHLGETRAYLDEIAKLHKKLEEARQKIDSLTNHLEDVVNELDLSESAIEKHGQIGTAPADLVRLVLEEKSK